jgi:enamine deaminase RidA (YjgF/YER057c/UK114 family)
VVAPLAAYFPAVRTGNLVFTAGQLPMVDGNLVRTGKVGAAVTPEQAAELARIAAFNALAAACGTASRASRSSSSTTRRESN